MQTIESLLPNSTSAVTPLRRSPSAWPPISEVVPRGNPPPDRSFLRKCAWEIGARRPLHSFEWSGSYITLAMCTPTLCFASWQIDPSTLEGLSREKGNRWHGGRLILRLYDVTFIEFNGFNAHRIADTPVELANGQCFIRLPGTGSHQLVEVGYLLRDGEFLPLARSCTVQFASAVQSNRSAADALYVDDRLRPEPVASPWDAEAHVRERSRPKPKSQLRIAAFSFESVATGHQSDLAVFVTELSQGLAAAGHDVHLFVPTCSQLPASRQVGGVFLHPLDMESQEDAIDAAWAFARAADAAMRNLPAFDLYHMHEWMTALVPWVGTKPTILSLTSIEGTRRNGSPTNEASCAIETMEREVAQAVDCLITPDWLRPHVLTDLGVGEDRVHEFPVKGRAHNEWDCPLDVGQVKVEFGLGPMDRLVTFVGPLEQGAAPDLLLEALPVVLGRASNARVAFVGEGSMAGRLHARGHDLGVHHAIRLVGSVDHPRLVRLLRASAALVLPSRCRVAGDEIVIDLARFAGIPVVTTHAGPSHLVRHDHDGLITYDNPGSVVWALDRLFGDLEHAGRLGRQGRRETKERPAWNRVVVRFVDLCAQLFPELAQQPESD